MTTNAEYWQSLSEFNANLQATDYKKIAGLLITYGDNMDKITHILCRRVAYVHDNEVQLVEYRLAILYGDEIRFYSRSKKTGTYVRNDTLSVTEYNFLIEHGHLLFPTYLPRLP